MLIDKLLGTKSKTLRAQFIEYQVTSDDLSTYSFSVSNYGPGTIVIFAHVRDTASLSVNSISFDGNECDIIQEASGGINFISTVVASIYVASTTSGLITIELSNVAGSCGISTYLIPEENIIVSAAEGTIQTGAPNTNNATITLSSEGAGAYLAATTVYESRTTSWTGGVVEDYDASDSTYGTLSGASISSFGSVAPVVTLNTSVPAISLVGAKFSYPEDTGIVFVGRSSSGDNTANSSYDVSLTGLALGTGSFVRAGDVIIVITTQSSTGSSSSEATAPTGFTEIANLFANDTYDTSMCVSYKISDGTETSVTIPRLANASFGSSTIACVWRNVDQTTPMDVSSTTVTSVNTGLPNAPAITPVTAGAVIIACGGASTAAASNTIILAQPTGMTGIASTRGIGTSSVGKVAAAYYTGWTSGSYNPAAFTGGGTDSTSYSAAAVTLALRPAY